MSLSARSHRIIARADGCFPPLYFPPIIVMALRGALVRSLLRGDGRGAHC
jgi:hypothetical protein